MLRELCRVSGARAVIGQILLMVCVLTIGCSESPPPPPPVVDVPVPLKNRKSLNWLKWLTSC